MSKEFYLIFKGFQVVHKWSHSCNASKDAFLARGMFLRAVFINISENNLVQIKKDEGKDYNNFHSIQKFDQTLLSQQACCLLLLQEYRIPFCNIGIKIFVIDTEGEQ